ncbi:hypothetical protein ZIOFF_031528 [Zingiber officinale]|uniref:Uncharacterized protein n=1 Tax=Zingiber officinale TaxID=94328 RepID=A0A8J5L5A2_ZINOF|nr:hypothetical protein ZIOFF_031528 [Zingiber officinale]
MLENRRRVGALPRHAVGTHPITQEDFSQFSSIHMFDIVVRHHAGKKTPASSWFVGTDVERPEQAFQHGNASRRSKVPANNVTCSGTPFSDDITALLHDLNDVGDGEEAILIPHAAELSWLPAPSTLLDEEGSAIAPAAGTLETLRRSRWRTQ